MKITIPIWILPIAYIVIGLLSSAFIHKHDSDCQPKAKDDYRFSGCGPSTVISGVAWPLYWGWQGALRIIP